MTHAKTHSHANATFLAAVMLTAVPAAPAALGLPTEDVDTYVLDLTAPAIREARADAEAEGERKCKTFSGSGGGTSAPRPELPLVLELVTLETDSYRMGDNVIAQLRLTNIGAGAVRIPWSWDRRTAHIDLCSDKLKNLTGGWLEGSFDLIFTDDRGVKRLIPLPKLYGALDVPTSYRVLHRGESALLRAPARLFFTGDLTYRPDVPQNVTVSAAYGLQTSSMGWHKEVQSANSLRAKISQ